MEISFIGSGNVATHLARALAYHFNIGFVISSSLKSARELALQIEAVPTEDYLTLKKSDVIIICVPDDVISEVALQLFQIENRAIIAHVSGSKGAELLLHASTDYGVMYPLQTFTKGKSIELSKVPFFVNGNSQKAVDTLMKIAQKLSNQVHLLSDEKRMHLHIAAVIANNFTNHLLYQTQKFLLKEKLKLEYLEPLIRETISKSFDITPYKAQTGPSKRKDNEVINTHLAYLKDEEDLKDLYTLFTKLIIKTYENR